MRRFFPGDTYARVKVLAQNTSRAWLARAKLNLLVDAADKLARGLGLRSERQLVPPVDNITQIVERLLVEEVVQI
eukprot:9165563-Prorocentrum_lima.AAC.1